MKVRCGGEVATKIRGNQAREELKKKEAATKLQANFRGHKAKEEIREKGGCNQDAGCISRHHARDEMAQRLVVKLRY